MEVGGNTKYKIGNVRIQQKSFQRNCLCTKGQAGYLKNKNSNQLTKICLCKRSFFPTRLVLYNLLQCLKHINYPVRKINSNQFQKGKWCCQRTGFQFLRVSLYQDGCRKRIYFVGKVEEPCSIICPKGLEKYLKIPMT